MSGEHSPHIAWFLANYCLMDLFTESSSIKEFGSARLRDNDLEYLKKFRDFFFLLILRDHTVHTEIRICLIIFLNYGLVAPFKLWKFQIRIE